MTQLRTLLPFSMLRVCVHYLYVVHWGLIELSALYKNDEWAEA